MLEAGSLSGHAGSSCGWIPFQCRIGADLTSSVMIIFGRTSPVVAVTTVSFAATVTRECSPRCFVDL